MIELSKEQFSFLYSTFAFTLLCSLLFAVFFRDVFWVKVVGVVVCVISFFALTLTSVYDAYLDHKRDNEGKEE